MIKINPSNIETLAKQIKQKETKSVSFIQKKGEKIVACCGYIFNNPDPRTKDLAIYKLNKAANLPEKCGDIFVTIA